VSSDFSTGRSNQLFNESNPEVVHELTRSEETLRLACEGADVGIWRRDIASGKEIWSPKYYELYGFTPTTIPSFENWLAAVHPADKLLVLDDQARVVQGHLVQLQNEFRILHPSGIRWIREIGRTFYDPHGHPIEMVGIALDVTQVKLREEELARVSYRKDEFLSMLAHELRNSLSVITTALSLAKRMNKPSEWTDQLIRKQVNSLTGLVGDLLDLSRLTQGKVTLRCQQLDVRKVVSELIEEAELLFHVNSHEFSIEAPAGRVYVDADPLRFEQMITNILHNACKYTPPRGKIVVSIAEQPQWVSISVKDNGIGIEPKLLHSVFDLYTQLNPQQTGRTDHFDTTSPGLGIGLSVVKQLIDMHGGQIEAFSEGRGKGSVFTLRFPKAPASNGSSDALLGTR